MYVCLFFEQDADLGKANVSLSKLGYPKFAESS